MRYAVDTCQDDTAHLRDKLHEIAIEKGRVVSVIWQPTRRVEIGNDETNPLSGYVIVSEFD